MAHALSASFSRFEHMPPQAAGLALLLHAAIALALWWASPIQPHDEPAGAIEVTLEQPSSPPPPPPPSPEPQHQSTPSAPPLAPPSGLAATPQAPGVSLGMPPPAPPAEKAQREEPTQQQQQQQQLQALAPLPPAAPLPTFERSLPALDMPPPPATADVLPKPALPPLPEPQPKPEAKPAPRSAAPSQQATTTLQPSPLSRLPQEHTPSQSQPKASEPQTAFVNPATSYTLTHAKDEYLWSVIHKFSLHLPVLREKNEGGTVVIRMVIARDGRLLDVSIARSSGVPALDNGMLQSVRIAAPYPPFPPEIPDAQLVFIQPFVARP